MVGCPNTGRVTHCDSEDDWLEADSPEQAIAMLSLESEVLYVGPRHSP